MPIKKSLLAVGAVTSISLASIAGVGVASAASTDTGDSALINKIATKFNLNKDEVKAVFDADRTAHEAEQQKKVEEDLTQAVKDGKITQAQKELILAKQKEVKSAIEADKDSMENKSGSERKAAMEQKRANLETWAKQNNIPTDYLRYVMMHGGHMHGGPGKPGEPSSDSSGQTTN